MSSAPSKTNWLQQNYEKAILIGVLLALLVSAVVLVLQVTEGQRLLDVSGTSIKPAADQTVKPLDFQAMERGAAQMTEPFKPRELSGRMFQSEVRVYCIKCGKSIAWEAEVCPFCGEKYPPVADEPRMDSDQDGMVDVYEKDNGFDMFNPEDARMDADGDGFSNLEEMIAKTDPRDPKSSPSVVAKLRVAQVKTEPFRLLFKAVQQLSADVQAYQISSLTIDRTYFKKLGETIEGFTIEKFDSASKSLFLRKGRDVKKLTLGQVVSDDQYRVQFAFLIDGKVFWSKVGEAFDLRGSKCNVLEVSPRRDWVRIRVDGENDDRQVRFMTMDDRTEMETRKRAILMLEGTPGQAGGMPTAYPAGAPVPAPMLLPPPAPTIPNPPAGLN